MELNLPIESYETRSKPASPSKLVNCFPEALPEGGKGPVALTRAPGITAWTTVGSGPIKGMYASFVNFASGALDRLYVVSGSELYSVDVAGATTLLGDVGTPVNIDIDSNVDSVVVVNEPHAFYYDGATFAEILDDDFTSRGAGDVEFLDNFLLFREPDSGRFFGSEYGSTTDYNALNFAVADSNPDNMNGMKAAHRQLVTFGVESGEIYENTGVAGFPFERNINGTFEEGCHNSKTVVLLDNLLYWVADDLTVRRLQGITPTRISTHAIDQKLEAETVDSAFGYDQEGHFFYVVKTSGGSYTYDITAGKWAQRQTYGNDNWTIEHSVRWASKVLVGDGSSNKIGYLDFSSYEDWGATQRMEWTYMPVFAAGQRAFHNRFEVVMEAGVGLTTGQGSDPKIMLQYSDDGGKTFVSMPDRSIGALGNPHVRAVWHNLGSSRQRVYRCAVSDPVQITVTNTLLEVDGGRL